MECQGDHGRYGANYRCCLPALAGFVSPHSVGPDDDECAARMRWLQGELEKAYGESLIRSGDAGFARHDVWNQPKVPFCEA
ncbi:MAG: hypothetical protein QOD03_508 [Verrucomicrobiota bacterium]